MRTGRCKCFWREMRTVKFCNDVKFLFEVFRTLPGCQRFYFGVMYFCFCLPLERAINMSLSGSVKQGMVPRHT